MDSSQLIGQQRQKESRWLKRFLFGSVCGSIALHGLAWGWQVRNWWSDRPVTTDSEMEVTISNVTPDRPPEPLATPPPTDPVTKPQRDRVPLAPQSQAPLKAGEDAPTRNPNPTADRDPIAPGTSPTGDAPAMATGTGPISDPNGTGDGFGNASQAT